MNIEEAKTEADLKAYVEEQASVLLGAVRARAASLGLKRTETGLTQLVAAALVWTGICTAVADGIPRKVIKEWTRAFVDMAYGRQPRVTLA